MPKIILDRSIDRATLQTLFDKVEPGLSHLEKRVKPRGKWLFGGMGQKVFGGMILLLAICVQVPLPFSNMFPSLAICLMAVGLLERDALWMLIGTGVGIIAGGIVATATWGAIKIALLALGS